MSFHETLFDLIENFSLFGRNGWEYLLAISLFLGLMLLSIILRDVILTRVEKYLETREDFSRTMSLVGSIKKLLNFKLITLFSVYIAIESLDPSETISNAMRFLLLFIFSYFLIQLSFFMVDYLITFRSERSSDSTNILEFFRLVLKTAVFIMIGLWFLSNLGINTDVFIASIGVFSLAIAFSLQNVISDVFAALTIYLDKPIEIGDTVVIGGEIGVVEKIGIRSTRIRVLAGHMLIVSNREIINTRINNYQKMERRRVLFPLGVHCNTSPRVLREIPGIVEEIVKSVGTTQFDRAYLNNLGDFSYDFEVVYFVLSRSYSKYLETHEKVILRIIEIFDERDITIPYPTQSLFVQKETQEVI